MKEKIAKMEVDSRKDYYNNLIKVLENAGYIIAKDGEGLTSNFYLIIGEPEEKTCKTCKYSNCIVRDNKTVSKFWPCTECGYGVLFDKWEAKE